MKNLNNQTYCENLYNFVSEIPQQSWFETIQTNTKCRNLKIEYLRLMFISYKLSNSKNNESIKKFIEHIDLFLNHVQESLSSLYLEEYLRKIKQLAF